MGSGTSENVPLTQINVAISRGIWRRHGIKYSHASQNSGRTPVLTTAVKMKEIY
jgi:hypothetical protein